MASASPNEAPWEPPDEAWKNTLQQRILKSVQPQVIEAKEEHAAALASISKDDSAARAALTAQHDQVIHTIRRAAQEEYETHLQGEILQRRWVAEHKLDAGEWAALQQYQKTFYEHAAKGSPDRERTRSHEPRSGAQVSASAMARSASGGTSGMGSAPRESAAGTLLRPFAAGPPESGRRRNDSVVSTSSFENGLWPTSRKRASSNSSGSAPAGAIRIPGSSERERWNPLTPPADESVPRGQRAPLATTPDSDSVIGDRSASRFSGRSQGWKQSVSPGPGRAQSSRTLTAALLESNPVEERPVAILPEPIITSELEEPLSDTPAPEAENWSDTRRGKRPSRPQRSRTGSKTAPGSPSMLSPSLLSPPLPSASQGVTLVEARGTPTGSPTPFQPIDISPSAYPAPSSRPTPSAPPTNNRRTSASAMRRYGRPSELGLVDMPSTASPPSADVIIPPPPSSVRFADDMGPPALPTSRSMSQALSGIATRHTLNTKRSTSNIVPPSASPRAMSFDPIAAPAGASPPSHPFDGRRAGVVPASPSGGGWYGPAESASSSASRARRASAPLSQAPDEPSAPASTNGSRLRRGSASSVTSPASAEGGVPVLRPRRSGVSLREDTDGTGPSPRARAWFGPEPIPEHDQLELPPQPPEPSPRDRDGSLSSSRNGSLRSRSSRDYMRNFVPEIYTPSRPRKSGPGGGEESEEDDWPERQNIRARGATKEDVTRRDMDAARRETELRMREEAAKTRGEELEAVTRELAVREEEVRRLEVDVAQQLEEVQQQAADLAKKEEEVEAAFQEVQRREEELRQREEDLAIREGDLGRRELFFERQHEHGQQEEQWEQVTPEEGQQEEFGYQQGDPERPRSRDGERVRVPSSGPLLSDTVQFGEESLIDDEPLLAPPAPGSLTPPPRLSTQLSTFEALLDPITPIDRTSTDTPLADDERTVSQFTQRGPAKMRKRDEKLRRAADEERQRREEEENRQRLEEEEEDRRRLEEEEEYHRAEFARQRHLEGLARVPEEDHSLEEEEQQEEHRREGEHMQEGRRTPFTDDTDERQRSYTDVDDADSDLGEEPTEARRALPDHPPHEERHYEEYPHDPDQQWREDNFRRQQREEQLKEDERYAKQIMEEQERERQVQLERQRQQRHAEAMRRAQEERDALEEGFRLAREAEREKLEEEAAREAAAAAERRYREEQQQRQREEDDRRREREARQAHQRAVPSFPPPAFVPGPTLISIPDRTNTIPIPADRASSSSSTWNAGVPPINGWSTSTRAASASTAASSRPAGAAAGTSPGSNPHRTAGASGHSPGAVPFGTSASRGAPLSEAEWARRQAEQAQKQQDQFRRDQERVAQERQTTASRPFNKDALVALFQQHEQQWELIREAYKIRWDTLPWPVFRRPKGPEDLTTDAIGAYVLSQYYPTDKSYKDRIKEHMRRWHPDRFETQFLPKVNEEERETVKEGAGWVVRALNELLARTNAAGMFD